MEIISDVHAMEMKCFKMYLKDAFNCAIDLPKD